MKACSRVPLFLSIALQWTVVVVDAVTHQQKQRTLLGNDHYVCSLTANIFRFEWDPITETHVFIDGEAENNATDFLPIHNTNTLPQPHDRQLGVIREVRVCWCTEYAQRDYEFCPMEFDTCIVPHNKSESVSCYSAQPADTFVRSFWPALVFWCAATVYALLCSEPGLYARQCCIRWCGCVRGPEMVERLLEDNPQRAAGLFRQHLVWRWRNRRRRQHWEKVWRKLVWWRKPAEPTAPAQDSLVLKTRVFQIEKEKSDDAEAPGIDSAAGEEQEDDTGNEAEQNDSGEVGIQQHEDDDNGQPQCAICLLELEDGDVIGDITCGHLLHKDCLKDWLVRKNKCPLCQKAGIARLVVCSNSTSHNW